MGDHITLEMMLYGATSFGGSIIHLGQNKVARTELWKIISVLLTGFLFGMAFTIPVQETIEATFENIHIGEGSRVAISLVLGMVAPYVFGIINKLFKRLNDDPSLIYKGFIEMIKRIFNLKYVRISH